MSGQEARMGKAKWSHVGSGLLIGSLAGGVTGAAAMALAWATWSATFSPLAAGCFLVVALAALLPGPVCIWIGWKLICDDD